jgi:ppGpp synthetase/RelA/SpoT-type nucleotidyltranferase
VIHQEIINKVDQKEWILAEPPKAYTWDPESEKFYGKLGIKTEVKDSFYTSVYYLIKLNNGNDLCCEIQVRTLFEEIWGEIAHAINYPYPINSVACSEQLKVLSKLVSTGTKLSDSIFKSYNEYSEKMGNKGQKENTL